MITVMSAYPVSIIGKNRTRIRGEDTKGTMLFHELPIFECIREELSCFNKNGAGSAGSLALSLRNNATTSREGHKILSFSEYGESQDEVRSYNSPPLSAYSATYSFPYRINRRDANETMMTIDQRRSQLVTTKRLGFKIFKPIGYGNISRRNVHTQKGHIFNNNHSFVDFRFHETQIQTQNEDESENIGIINSHNPEGNDLLDRNIQEEEEEEDEEEQEVPDGEEEPDVDYLENNYWSDDEDNDGLIMLDGTDEMTTNDNTGFRIPDDHFRNAIFNRMRSSSLRAEERLEQSSDIESENEDSPTANKCVGITD